MLRERRLPDELPKGGLIRRLDERIRCNPNDLDALLSRGRAYHEEGCIDEAISDYTQAIELDSKYAKCAGVYIECAKVYTDRGYAYSKKRDYDRAIRDYTQAIELDSKNVKAYHGRGLAYRYHKSMDKKQDLKKAIEDYTQAVNLGSKYTGLARVYADRGYAYNNRNIGMYDEAIDDLTKAICLGTNTAEVYNQRGNAYRRKGCFKQARSDYKKAIKIGPEYAAAYNSMGNCCRDLCEYNEALEYYEKAIDLKPEKAAMTYINRGNVHEEMGCRAKAVDDFDNAVRSCFNNWRDNFADVSFVLGGETAVKKAIGLIKPLAGRKGCLPTCGKQAYYRGVLFLLRDNSTKIAKKCFEFAQREGYAKVRVNEHLQNLR